MIGYHTDLGRKRRVSTDKIVATVIGTDRISVATHIAAIDIRYKSYAVILPTCDQGQANLQGAA